MSRRLEYEEAAQEIIEFIKECDSDTLAAVYENCFGAVKSCEEAEDGDYFIVTYHEGLEPE